MIFFIGRKDELDQLKKIFESGSSVQILNICGEAGIGKTLLLHKMQKCCETIPDKVIFNKEIIDFFNFETRTRIGLIKQIAYNFNINNFPNFKQILNLLPKSTNSKELEYLQLQAEEGFKDDFIRLAAKIKIEGKKIVIFFDSYESIQEIGFKETKIRIHEKHWTTEEWIEKELLCWIHQNTFFVISGRRELQEVNTYKWEVNRIKLAPFTKGETKLFLRRYFGISNDREFKNRIGDTFSEELHDLTNGYPILLALFVDSMFNQDLDSVEKFLSALQQETEKLLDKKKIPFKDAKIQSFEKLLITHISLLAEFKARAITSMAIAYRWMSSELFLYLIVEHPIREPKSAKDMLLEELLFNELRYLPIIKCKKGGHFLLHREIRRLILRYWWQKQDPAEETRKAIVTQIVEYYRDKFLGDSNLSEETLYLYTAESIEYTLFIHSEVGLDYFCEKFEVAIQKQQFTYSIILVNILGNYNSYLKNYPIQERDPNIISFFEEVIELLREWINYKANNGENYEIILRKIRGLKGRYQNGSFVLNSRINQYLEQIAIDIQTRCSRDSLSPSYEDLSSQKISQSISSEEIESGAALHADNYRKLRIPTPLCQKIVDFLVSLPNIQDNNNRQALIGSIGFELELYAQIDFSGASAIFFQRLLSTLSSYGKLKDGRHAIEALLNTAKKTVGLDRQAYCDNLISELRRLITS